jgi:Flp pilus assembly protein TadD
LAQRLLTQPRVVLFYLSLIFYPHPGRLNLDHDFSLSFSFLDPPSTSVSLIVISALCIAAIFLAKRHRLMSFGILWFLGNLVIESSIIGLEILFEHRLYLPSMFLMVALVHLLLTRIHPKGLVVGILLALGTICTVWTYQRNLVWADPVLFWEDTIRKSPEKPRAYNNLGIVLFGKGQYQAAADAFREAIIRGPRTPKPNYNLASALIRMGRLDEAAEQLEITLRRAPANHLAHNNLALVRLLQGRLEDAEKHFRSAIRIKPDYTNAYSNLGALMRRQGKLEEAIAYLETAIELDPGYAEAYNNLGYTLKQQGKLKTAVAHFEKALDLAPGYQMAQKNLEETRALLEAP